MAVDEERLRGGDITAGVVRVGKTVRRPRHDRSAFASRVLLALEDLGLAWAPSYLGVDGAGRDVFSYADGVTTDHPSQRDERSYAAVGRLLRELHDRTRGTGIAVGGDCIVHGDPGPFNVVMQDGMPSVLIDWDSVHAGDALEDVGYAGWTWCVQSIGNVPIEDQARRLRSFRDGYDPSLSAEVVLQAVEERQTWIADTEARVRDRSTTSGARREHAHDSVTWAERDRSLLLANRVTFLAAFTE